MKIRFMVAEVFRVGYVTRHQQQTINLLMRLPCDLEDRAALDRLTNALISGQVSLTEETEVPLESLFQHP